MENYLNDTLAQVGRLTMHFTLSMVTMARNTYLFNNERLVMYTSMCLGTLSSFLYITVENFRNTLDLMAIVVNGDCEFNGFSDYVLNTYKNLLMIIF